MASSNLYIPHKGRGRPCQWILGSCWSVRAGSGPPSSHPVTKNQISAREVTLQKEQPVTTGNSINRLMTHPEDKIVPLWDDVTEWTSIMWLTERYTTVHTPVKIIQVFYIYIHTEQKIQQSVKKTRGTYWQRIYRVIKHKCMVILWQLTWILYEIKLNFYNNFTFIWLINKHQWFLNHNVVVNLIYSIITHCIKWLPV